MDRCGSKVSKPWWSQFWWTKFLSGYFFPIYIFTSMGWYGRKKKFPRNNFDEMSEQQRARLRNLFVSMFIGEGGGKKLLTIELIARELPYIRFINQIIDKWFFSRRARLEKKRKKKNWKKLYNTRFVTEHQISTFKRK